MSTDGSVVLVAETQHDFDDASRPSPFVRSVINAWNATSGEERWTATWTDLVVGTPVLGGPASHGSLVVPAWAVELAPSSVNLQNLVLLLDPRTGEERSRCLLGEYSGGDRLMLAGPADDGFFTLSSGGRLCSYGSNSCEAMGCVVLQFDDERGLLEVPSTLPVGLPQDATARAYAATLANDVVGDRYLPRPSLAPIRFDAPCYIRGAAGFEIHETRSSEVAPLRILPQLSGAAQTTATGKCGGPIVALTSDLHIWSNSGGTWTKVR